MTRMMLAFALMFSLLAVRADDKPQADAPKADKSVTFTVSGIGCNHCEKIVVDAFTAVKGVAKVVADGDKGLVTIEYDSKAVTEDALLTALKDKPKYTVAKAAK